MLNTFQLYAWWVLPILDIDWRLTTEIPVIAAEAMVQAQMFHISDLDQFLAKTLSTTSRLANSRAAGIAIEFSQQLVRACLVDSSLLAPGDLSATLDVLDAIGSSNLGMQRLNNIVLQARQPRRYVACRSCSCCSFLPALWQAGSPSVVPALPFDGMSAFLFLFTDSLYVLDSVRSSKLGLKTSDVTSWPEPISLVRVVALVLMSIMPTLSELCSYRMTRLTGCR